MDVSERCSDRRVATSVASCLALGLLPIVAYVALWEWADPSHYLYLLFGTYLLLAGFGVVQMLRALRTDGWTRRLGAFGLVVGFATAVFLGLQPRPDCLDFGPCPLRGLTLHPLQLAFGILVVTGSLYLDVGHRANPFVGE